MSKMLKILLGVVLSITFVYASEQVPTREEVAKLYVATFNRAPDSTGLSYWTNDSFDGHPTLSRIAQSFFDAPETQILYPTGTSNADFIISVYANLFNRNPDTDGLNYWENQLIIGSFSKNSFIIAVINGAQNTAISNDVDILTNKTTVGIAFADAGLDDRDQAKTVMSGVTADSTSVSSATTEIENFTSGVAENSAPIAKAGLDQTVTQSDGVTLDASGSSDSDGTINSYEWKEGSTVLSTSSSFSKSEFAVGIHTITLTVTDNDGATASDSVVVTVNAPVSNSTIKKTGQTISYTDYDDGYYQKGQSPRYTRASNSVTDELTHLMWQDDATPATMAWDTAQTYCSNLSLDGYIDWRVPTRKELVGISDYGRYAPAIDPEFQNTASNTYWSSTANVQFVGVWTVNFRYGNEYSNSSKTYNNYIRCVRAEQ